MPILSELENMELFGFRKIWTFPNNMSLDDIKYHRYISANPSAPHYMFHFGSFAFESMNCLIIAFIIL
jgi:large-conductance mechanosensitive channel